jgi:hypothetical protein
MFDNILVRKRHAEHGILEKPKKEKATMSRRSPIETENEFVEIVRQMFNTGCALVGAQEPAFEERYGKMSDLQWFVSNTGIFALHNAIVPRRFKPVISMPTICPNRDRPHPLET